MTSDELKAFVQGMSVNGITVNGVFGGTEMMEQTVLWEGELTATDEMTVTLNDNISNYDAIYAEYINATSTSNPITSLSPVHIGEESGVFETFITMYRSSSWYQTVYIYAIGTSAKLQLLKSGSTQSLKKIVGVKFISRINYSLSEQCIGTWVDGKPLYQKTVIIKSLPSISGQYVTYAHNISNIDQIAYTVGSARFATGRVRPLQSTIFTSSLSINVASINYDVDKTNINVIVGQDRSSVSAEVIINYTKITD